MSKNRLRQLLGAWWPAIWPSALIFSLTLTIFLLSRVHQVTDSKFSMLASQSLLERGTYGLEHYALPRHAPLNRGYYFSNGELYQLELANGHILYHLPPGSSVLSVPYVALMKMVGVSTTTADGAYNVRGEVIIQYTLAALLMAGLTVIFFHTARLAQLTRGWSALIALGGALGTPVWSTASRGLWSDTWGIALLGVVIWMLLAQEVAGRRLKPVLLASLLSWLFFVRPTNAVHITAVTVYVFVFYRRLFLAYAATGAVWLALFIAFSWRYYGTTLPSYYQANRLGFSAFWGALAGNVISPARGLLVYVPVLLFVAYLLVRYRRDLLAPGLVVLSLAVMAGHLAAISGFAHWWGGHSFGPRFSTGLVPWLVLLAILGVRAMLTWRERERSPRASLAWRAPLMAGGALLLLSVFIHARGAMSHATWLWNVKPRDVDKFPERVWDYREPQFLAGLVPTPLPREFPLISGYVDFSTMDADRYLWHGWAFREEQFRWTESKEATLIFGLDAITDVALDMKLGPFLAPPKLSEQRVLLKLNGQLIETLVLREEKAAEYQLLLPKGLLREQNLLAFELPDANSPRDLGVGEDPRQLGIAVYWIQLRPRETASR